jgi:hypothetical protein
MRAYVFDTEADWSAALGSIETYLCMAAEAMGYTVIAGKVYPKRNGITDLTAQPIVQYVDTTGDYQLTDGRYYLPSLADMFPIVAADGHVPIPQATYPYIETVLGLADKVEDVSALIMQEEE